MLPYCGSRSKRRLLKKAKEKCCLPSKETPGLIPDLLVFKESVVKDRADDVQKIIDAWFEALEYFKTHEEESIALMARESRDDAGRFANSGWIASSYSA